jgi:hypothetical protein
MQIRTRKKGEKSFFLTFSQDFFSLVWNVCVDGFSLFVNDLRAKYSSAKETFRDGQFLFTSFFILVPNKIKIKL